MLSKLKLNKNEMKAIDGGDIRKYRDEKCYTQEYMANRLGIGQSAYQKIESGESKISVERLTQIARILEKPLESLIIGDQDEHKTSITEKELLLMQKTIILQQERRITELEEKIERRNHKIEALKQQLGLK